MNCMRPKDTKHKTALLLRTRTNTDWSSDRSSWTAWGRMSSRAARVKNYVIWQACMNDALRYWDTATSTRVSFLRQSIEFSIQKITPPFLWFWCLRACNMGMHDVQIGRLLWINSVNDVDSRKPRIQVHYSDVTETSPMVWSLLAFLRSSPAVRRYVHRNTGCESVNWFGSYGVEKHEDMIT